MTTVLFMDHFSAPHGRFLDDVESVEGSALLSAPGGGLREVDAGKMIAIPGAADLDANIVRLHDGREFTGRMETGSDVLIATFPDPEDQINGVFQGRVHKGMRITVAGAAAGGGTLLTNVDEVIDRHTLQLAAAAAIGVAAAATAINDPLQIHLSDYARATVEGLTVDLGDRVVHDAAMTIGHTALRSATARFSSLDLTKNVTIRAAGRHVTTIASVPDSTHAVLSTPAVRSARTPADVWRAPTEPYADTRVGFEELLATLAASDVESAEIRFGTGVYDFTPDTRPARRGGISLHGLKNLTLSGAGPGATILRLRPDQSLPGDSHVIHLRDCARITVRDLSIHGAYLTMATVNEQMHGLFIAEGCREITAERVRAYQTAGDGIRLLGSSSEPVQTVWIDSCRLIENKRSGIAFQRSVERVWVRGCHIEMVPPSTDACLDFEPTGNTTDIAPRDIVIDANSMLHGTEAIAVALSGHNADDRLTQLRFTNNLLIGGSIFVTDVDGLLVRGNFVVVPPDAPRRIALDINRGGRDLVIDANVLVNSHSDLEGHPELEAALRLSRAGGRGVRRAIVTGNACVTASGAGIAVVSASDVIVTGNVIVSTGDARDGVRVVANNVNVSGIAIRDNRITVDGPGAWENGIAVRGNEHVDDIVIAENSIAGADAGISFADAKCRQTPVCALNHIGAGVAAPLVGLLNLPEQAVLVGGATIGGGDGTALGTGRQLTGIGDPDTTGVSGNVGDIYLRLDGSPGQTIYVKESDAAPIVGWVAK
jgi:hypothetical protein